MTLSVQQLTKRAARTGNALKNIAALNKAAAFHKAAAGPKPRSGQARRGWSPLDWCTLVLSPELRCGPWAQIN